LAKGLVYDIPTRNEITQVIDEAYGVELTGHNPGGWVTYDFEIVESQTLSQISDNGSMATGSCWVKINSTHSSYQNISYSNTFSIQSTELR
jgi:hypothetical protein